MKPERIEPGPGKESVWDYPRPPRIEETARRVRVVFDRVVIADTRRAKRVLETSHPPAYYIPLDDVKREYLTHSNRSSFCEWKGHASYYSIKSSATESRDAAWFYPDPTPAFASIKDHVAFYPSRIDACYVDDERVRAQAGDFYGGWITNEIVGPFKGEPGTRTW